MGTLVKYPFPGNVRELEHFIQRTVTLANGYKKSEELRGEGDAKAAEIYANAFNRNADFYSFYRSLTAYRKVFEQGGDMMVLEPDSDFFRYFSSKSGQ